MSKTASHSRPIVMPRARRSSAQEGLRRTGPALPRTLQGPAAWIAGFALVFAAVTLWRWEIIASPPYWDSAMGLFLEADFLARTHFDYARLVSHEPRFLEGGSAIYIISLLPTLLAAAMTWLPTTREVLIAGHLFTFATAAALVLLLFASLRPYLARHQAGLVCLALVTTPLFAAQVDMIGMDLPMACAAALGLLCVARGRLVLAAAASLLAFFVKISGGIVTAALVVFCAALLPLAWSGGSPGKRRTLVLGGGAALVALGIELMATDWAIGLPHSAAEQYESNLPEGVSSLAEARFWCPDLLVLLAAALLTFGLLSLGDLRRRCRALGEQGRRQRLVKSVFDWVEDNRVQLFAWIVILATLAVLSRMYTIPRYLTLPLIFLWFNVGLMAFHRLRWNVVATVFIAAIVAFNLLNMEGRFYPPATSYDRFDGRTGAFLERSREYLADHRANIELVNVLKREANGRRIVTFNPFVHFLSLPSLGYVDAPLAGYAANSFHTETFPPVARLRQDPPQDLLFAWAANRFAPLAQCVFPQPGFGDRVLYAQGGVGSLVAFQVGALDRLDAVARKDRYLQILWPGDTLVEEAERLLAVGERSAAIEAYLRALEREPLRLDVRRRLVDLLVAAGQHDAALAQCRFLLEQGSQDVATHKLMAAILMDAGRFSEAVEHAQAAIALKPDDADAYVTLGVIEGRGQRLERAAAAFRTAIDYQPTSAAAHYWLGVTQMKQGDEARALESLQRAVALDPRHAEAHAALADLFGKQGDDAGALYHLRQALETRPNWPEIVNKAAWLLATNPDARLRDGEEAVRLAERLRESDAAHPSYLDTLAAAYAEAGRFDEAVETAQRALEAAHREGRSELARRIEQRLAGYRLKKPAHDAARTN